LHVLYGTAVVFFGRNRFQSGGERTRFLLVTLAHSPALGSFSRRITHWRERLPLKSSDTFPVDGFNGIRQTLFTGDDRDGLMAGYVNQLPRDTTRRWN